MSKWWYAGAFVTAAVLLVLSVVVGMPPVVGLLGLVVAGVAVVRWAATGR